jgi:hypothetical protein
MYCGRQECRKDLDAAQKLVEPPLSYAMCHVCDVNHVGCNVRHAACWWQATSFRPSASHHLATRVLNLQPRDAGEERDTRGAPWLNPLALYRFSHRLAFTACQCPRACSHHKHPYTLLSLTLLSLAQLAPPSTSHLSTHHLLCLSV